MTSDTPLIQHFNQLPLSSSLLEVLSDVGYRHPTPVQAGAIPPAVDGRDLMVQSQTGTGKTAAFSLPIIQRYHQAQGVAAIILAPTRELARQVAEEARRLSVHCDDFEVVCIYGGVSIETQITELQRKPKVVVGTPGRVIDHLRRKTLKLVNVKCFVLDEADEMLSMGFADELEEVLRFLPKDRQTLFFSATFPASVKRYAQRVLQDPLTLSFLDETSSADDLEHYYALVRGVARGKHIVNLIRETNPESALIFTNTRRDASRVAQLLTRSGLEANRLSGDMDQAERDRVMKKMKAKKVRLLVATDVAARGIDISQLSHVFHYQLPDNPEVYIHRSGRTGRAGAKGVVVSLASSQDLGVIYALRRFHKLELIERPLPKDLPPVSATSKVGRQKEIIRKDPISKPTTQEQESSSSDSSATRPAEVKTRRRTRRTRTEKDTDTQQKQVASTRQSEPSSQPKRLRTSQPRPEQTKPRLSVENDEAVSRSFDALQGRDTISQEQLKELFSLSRTDHLRLIETLREADELSNTLITLFDAFRVKEEATQTDDVDLSNFDDDHQEISSSYQDDEESTWLYINVGWRDCESGFSGVRDLIAELGGLLPEDVDQLKVKGRYSLVKVARSFERDLVDALSGETFAGKRLKVEPSTSQRSIKMTT